MKNKHTGLMTILLRVALVLLIEADIFTMPNTSPVMKTLFAIGILLIQANDYIRHAYRLLSTNRRLYYLSMSASIVGIGVYMVWFNSSATSVYYVFPAIELFLVTGALPVSMLVLHALVYLCAVLALKAGLKEALFPYLGMLLIVYLIRQINLEKEKGAAANAQLLEANAQLLAYSEEVKEMAVVKERTRIAQELHDSIGHGLVALKMHLEFAANVLDSNPRQSKEVIAKALGISKASMKDLRKAVDLLKEDSGKNSGGKLQESLEEIASSMHMSGRLTCQLVFDEAVEHAIPDIKNCIYKTVREAVTNGVKHGNPGAFQIEVAKRGHFIHVAVKDDGSGCSEISKSHGLRGIEERIQLLEGTVRFCSEKDRGFAVIAKIPYVTARESV
ncbi:sensor histidine kinase [Brevibacillus borstelensis]|uniref:sensor histidine kinase n=1 Tax=Brevibacillus borstelensis TaxID=45462 RepID=UPI002E20B041|nr:sensor histidine kinase [Brevibacillus borstelensis]